jgi:diguanylate cyclase (GGDEF)-like protein/PAS domain S-box-containing protein
VEKWVMERGRGVFTDQGELLALEGFISDITQQKYTEQTLRHAHAESEVRVYERTMELTQANEALRQYQVNFEAVVKNAHDGILIANAAGETVFANSKFAEIAGYPLAEMTQTTMRDLAHPDEYPMLAERLRRRVAGEAVPNTYETAICHKGGGKVPIEITASNVLWQGQPADLVIIRDISGRKQSEEMTAVRLRLMEFADTHSLEELLQYTLDEVGGLVDSPLGFFHFVEADQITLSLQAWSTRTEKEFCAAAGKGLHYSIDKAGVWVDAVHQKQPVIHNNYASLSHKKGLPEGHAVLTRELVVPILVNGRVVAILGVGNKPVEYTDQDVEIVAYLADVAWEITSRKKIEQELQQYRDHLEQVVQSRTGELVTANERLAQEAQERKINLAKYTTLFELFPLGITVAGTDGRILESNREAERMLGVSRQEQEQRTVGGSEWSIIRPDGTPMPAEEFASVRALQEQCRIENIEMGIVKGDQPITWINVTAAPIPAEGLGVAVVYSDITERKRTEEKLQQSEEKFRSLLDSQESNIQVIDYDGVHHYVNQVGALTIAGSGSAQNIIGKRLHDLFPADTADWQLEQIRRVITTGQGMSGDFQNEDNNQTTWWHLNLQPIRNASGQTAQVMVNSLDITERKRAETALKDSELFVSGVLNSLTAQIAVLDERGVIVSVNESWRKFADANGCPDPASYVGTNYLTVCEKAVNAGDQTAEGMLQGMRAVLAGSAAQFMDEYPCDAPGIPRWFTVTVLPQSQPRSGLIVVHQDITERKRAEQALRESTSSLQAVLQSTADGILAVDPGNRVLFMNGRFIEMWRLPESVLDSRDDAILLQHVIGQLSDPQVFLEKVQDVYRSEKENFDILNFKDGRVFERLSHPLIRDEMASGRVWSFRDVTARLHAEAALRESEIKYRIVADNTYDWEFWIDPQDRFVYLSPSCMRITGYDVEAFLADRSLLERIVHPEDRPIFEAHRADAKDQRPLREIEYRIIRADGEIRWVSHRCQSVYDGAGKFLGNRGSNRDITERKQMEEQLRENERRTATILRLSPIVIGVSTAAEGRYTDVNEAFEHVLGYSQAETLGHTSHELNLWVGEDTRANILREIQVHGRVENLDIQIRRKSGEVFPAQIFIVPITLHDTPCLLTMMMDITDRKQAEEKLRETHDALQTIIHSSPLAILALDPEDRVTMWNPAAEAMFGWPDKQVLGQVNPTVPENKVKEYEALRQATLNGMAFSNLDTLRMKKDGAQFPVSVSVAPLRGQQSQVIGRLHIIADSTERKKLQEELRQQATTDELTKVSNRRYFIELANSEIKRALRLRRPPSVALIDIDHFKQINDTYGHAVGDQALIRFAKICQMYIREIDVFARFGGDEFILLLPETNQEQAYEVLERIRLALMVQPLDLNGRQVALTISAGIASLSGDQDALDVLISQADQSLYRAKETGRNKVARYDALYE